MIVSRLTAPPLPGGLLIVKAPDGTYLQVDTYGSRQRRIPGKKSQSIRFAPEAVQQLKAILAKHFA